MKAERREISERFVPEEFFAQISRRRGAFFLDSALEAGGLGRYSFLGCEPEVSFSVNEERGRLVRNGVETTLKEDPLAVIRRLLREHQCEPEPEIPFPGGAVGYFSYEFGARLEKVKGPAGCGPAMPELELGFYNGLWMHDAHTGRAWMVAMGKEATERERVFQRLAGIATEREGRPREVARRLVTGEPASAFTREGYLDAIGRIKEYIASGDVYQVNLTQRFEMPFDEAPDDLYLRLRRRSPAPFAGFYRGEKLVLVSSSPERFLRIQGDLVETRPIKGTRPRGRKAAEDERLAQALALSVKDKAELLMIVDLERNDLGRVCVPGSVRVRALNVVERHPTVHHLVADVTGRLRPECDVVDCLRATLPGGSITGAPKIRAMQIIAEIEKGPRGPYTGAIGYLGYDGNCDLNIAIRTVVCTPGKASYQVGGGIVWDSDPAAEYQETLDKGAAMRAALLDAPMRTPTYEPKAMLNGRLVDTAELPVAGIGDGFMFGYGLFETIRVNEGHPLLLQDHWNRLETSARMLGLRLRGSCDELHRHCEAVVQANGLGQGSLKVVVYQDEGLDAGEMVVARRGLYAPEVYQRGFRLVFEYVAGRGGMAGHKTLNYLENILAKRRALEAGWDEPLFIGKDGEVFEGATTNLFVVKSGRVFTPPADGRLLPGVARGRVLRLLGDRGEEKQIKEGDVAGADEVFVTNALLGVMPVSAAGGRTYDLARNPVTRELMVRFAAEM